ncbi:outer membrane protein [Sphingomonas alpina]|uniref:Porin family protein n=1 Tax=Sphingomonas alpina TaxID=653931 RepID=A0A7H0LH41_9SPHN|nr:outer membrane beta-barrel protein [Sphingomonas alpina]QNQ08994.1 porin family protein [Sphingomonas alpina]
MKSCYLIAGALALVPTASLAQSAEDATFGGVKIGASLDYRWHDGEYSLPRIATRIDEDRGGIGYRAHIGYDAQIGSAFVIGGEAGFGRGGKTLRTESLAGDYSIKPRWNWDASGRVGVLPTRSILVYGRAGYSWLRVREKTDFRDIALKDKESSSTEGGILYGGGIETAISSGYFVRAEYNRVNYGDGFKSSKILLGVSVGF